MTRGLTRTTYQSEIGGERRIYVPVRPVCENLGLSWGSQRNRIYRDEVLREELRGVFKSGDTPS